MRTESQTSIHLLMAGTLSILTLFLGLVALTMSWELWMVLLMVLGCMAVWWLHIGRVGSDILYENICTGLLLVEFFFFGVHESCLHDIPMMTCVVLLLLSLLNRKRLLFIAVGLYVAQILYHFLLLGTIGRGMADRESLRLLMGAAAVAGSLIVTRYRINRRQGERAKYDSMQDQLATAVQQNADFLSNVSHELKTPVTAVSVMLENMLLGIGKYKDRDTYLARCKELTDRLAQMIKEILDASRAEFVGAQEQADFLIADALNAVIEPYQIIAKAKGIAFSVDAGEPFAVHLPQGMIEKAISNILANAVSYTKPDGTIYISCKGQRLIIENECMPIPPEHLTHIFEPFYRPDYGRDRAAGGNGLGLYLVATILKSLDIPYTFAPSENIEGMSFHILFT